MSESKVNQGKYAQNPDFKGTTKICFSNKFSTMAEKGVFFEIIVGAPTQQWAKLTSAEASAQDAASLDSMQASLQTVRNNLHEITRLQTQFRHREARHMHTAEDNNHRVFYFSLIECLVLVATSVVQVFFVRQLFGSTKKGGI
ncbi:hypothetical protein CAOG_001379 [Capsaspora owczarzaki ATCC 30864]|uniref:GOLD domain-containing protein n=2 Tax=Capsaspora owczarzaki (strain ATCC 30864) TaxID=595528 RepID=A0A0D2WJ30_CAPO3|nr:hypothetical protein CAOG_001379 [Capsaspora owczarzaki ATCC 30864]